MGHVKLPAYSSQNELTSAQQGAAPDRLQLRSSFLLTSLPAAGELGRSVAARGLEVCDTKNEQMNTSDEKPINTRSPREKTSRWLAMLSAALFIMGPIMLGLMWLTAVQENAIPKIWGPPGMSNHGPWHGYHGKEHLGTALSQSLIMPSFVLPYRVWLNQIG